MKSQMVVDKKSEQIICTDFCQGKTHDFRLFKESKLPIHPKTKTLADSGYTGINKLHANAEVPKKRSKKNPLTKEDKLNNRSLSSQRVLSENAISRVKKFRITSERYRNRRKRFGLRFNLVCGIHNFELNLAQL